MRTRFWVNLSIFLFILSVPNFLPPAKSVLCPLAAWGWETSYFGRDGQDGSNGRSGRKGRDGESQTIFADGTPVNLDLSGQNGEDGDDGDDGDNAFCGRQPYRVNRNLRAADGGDGGKAGKGGDGGDGGSLTVYYTNPVHLKNIAVRASGGDGGRAGRAGKAGYGCECDRHYWEEKVCTGTPGSSDYKCVTQRYSCRDGSNGRKGSSSTNGSTGNKGRLVLINQKEPLAPDAPEIRVPMSQLQEKSFKLSQNRWRTQTGATSLLAPGSIIADEYKEFVDRWETSLQVVWNDPRSLSDFSNKTVTINLQDDKQVQVNFPEDIWVVATQSQDKGVTQFVVSNAFGQNEVTQLKPAEFGGSGSNLNFSIVDLAGKSDIVSTQFWIKYRSTTADVRFSRDYENRFDYPTRFEGNIPAGAVTRNNNRFILNLGKLPISSEFLQPGVGVDIEVVATRSLGDRSTTQNITWKGEIPR